MQKIEVVVRITKDHCPPQEQTIFEWFDLMRNPTDALSRPDLEINLEHHRVFKHGTEVYMSRYEYGVLSLMAQHPGKLFTKEQIFEAVWHKDSESYLRAVTSTIGRIRQKIEDPPQRRQRSADSLQGVHRHDRGAGSPALCRAERLLCAADGGHQAPCQGGGRRCHLQSLSRSHQPSGIEPQL